MRPRQRAKERPPRPPELPTLSTSNDARARRLLEPGRSGPAKIGTRTARYPKECDSGVQRSCIYGLATMYCGLNPISKWPPVSKATCSRSADQGGTQALSAKYSFLSTDQAPGTWQALRCSPAWAPFHSDTNPQEWLLLFCR